MPAKGAPPGAPACSEELVEQQPDKRLHFSKSAAYVSISALSYAFWILYMCQHTDPEAAEKFYSQVPEALYMWPMIAFATAILLNLLSMAFERRPVKRQLCFLAVFISGVAFVYEFLAWQQVAPVYLTAAGRPISLLRYVMWAHATPLMLYALSMISDFSAAQVGQTIAVDIVMIVTVIPGELIPAWHRWIWNFISCAVYPYIFHQLWTMYSAAIAEARMDGTQASLRMLRNVTVVFWSVFPLVWVLVQLDWVSLFTEELLWCVADTCGKIFFSSTLLHSNFMSIEHRRMVAMRVVEEANRIKVIHELRQLLEQKESFIATMSHELRTPLNGIIGLSNVLLMDADTMPADTVKTLTTIRNSGARLLNLINDILDAAALRKGKLTVRHGKVNLRHVADDVLDLAAALAKPGVSVRNRIGAHIPQVVGDTSRIVQVLYNLVGNAAKFTERGDIWVDAVLSKGGDVVAVSVHDTGIGVPAHKLDDIFAPFAQVDMSTTRRYGGTGLGLNLVKQLVEAHGGQISVASRPGRGSVFTFTLRAWRDGEATPGPVSAEERRRLQAAARHAAHEADQELHGAEDGEDAPLLRGDDPPGRSAAAAAAAFGRRDSEADLTARLSHDAQPHNMLQRLSADSRMRSSYDADYTSYHKAPQQLSPQAAFSAFLSAGAHQVVKDIQRGAVEQPQDLAAKAAEERELRAAAAPPAAPRHDWLLADQAVRQGAVAGGIKVLSVDDDPVNQMVVQNTLTKAGLAVLKAADGQKALDMLQESVERGSPPHLMLLDVMMPGLSGYDVAREVRRRHPSLMLPIILVSANSREDHVVEGLQAGANDYVTKPFGGRELLARIHAQLRTQHFAQGVTEGAAAEEAAAPPPPPAPPAAAATAGRGGSVDAGPGVAGCGLLPRTSSAPELAAEEAAAVAASAAAALAVAAQAPPSASVQWQMGALQQQLTAAQQQLAALAAAAGTAPVLAQLQAAAASSAAVLAPPPPAANGAPHRSGSPGGGSIVSLESKDSGSPERRQPQAPLPPQLKQQQQQHAEPPLAPPAAAAGPACNGTSARGPGCSSPGSQKADSG